MDFFTSYRRQHYHSLFPTEIYGDLIGAIDVSASWIWRPAPRHQFRHAVATPVVSAALRTPYTGAKFMPDVLFGGPGRLVGMRYELEYASVGMGSSGWGAMYGLQVFRYPDPRPLLVATHRLAGVLRFGRIIPP
jgi:hypothetical protein